MYQVEGLKLSCMGALKIDLCKTNMSQILQDNNDLSCPCDKLKSRCLRCMK